MPAPSPIAPEPPAPSLPLPFSGFWRRILAFLVDVILLALAGYALGRTFGESFSMLGQWGRLVGFGIALTCFGVLNSRIGGGQTPGKRLLGIYVVGETWAFIPLPDALLRAAILTGPFFLQPLVHRHIGVNLVSVPLLLLFWSIDVGLVYFTLFNRQTRQSLHDLIVRSCVVTGAGEEDEEVPAVAGVHYTIFATLLAFSLLARGVAVEWVSSQWLTRRDALAGRMGTHLKLNALGGTGAGGLAVQTRYGLHGDNRETVTASVVLEDRLRVRTEIRSEARKRARRSWARLAKEAHPARRMRRLSVTQPTIFAAV